MVLAELVRPLQGFAKAMLDVADNLQRAVGMVEGRAQNSEEVDLEKTSALLTSLHDGVKLTDKILLQARALHQAQQFSVSNLLRAVTIWRLCVDELLLTGANVGGQASDAMCCSDAHLAHA